MPDTPLLYDDLTVRQHLELVALAHGVAGDGIDGRIDALLDRLGLADRADSCPASSRAACARRPSSPAR